MRREDRARQHQGNVFKKCGLATAGVTYNHQLGISEEGSLDINRPGISIFFGVSLRILVEHDAQTDIYVAQWDLEYAIVVDPRHVEPIEVTLDMLVIRCRWRDWRESNITSRSLGTYPWP